LSRAAVPTGDRAGPAAIIANEETGWPPRQAASAGQYFTPATAPAVAATAKLRRTRMSEPSDWNSKIIAEFRANGGKVGGQFEGAPLLLLHTVGAKSGQERVTPMMYQAAGDDFAVFASKAGAPTNPDWYYNLIANPQVRAEIGTETVAATARVAEGDERDQIWAAQKAAYPGFGDYERQTTRQIPVVILEPIR
jgi:deazaflavin-dependent oxidoreductase (nitroreductase family)